MEISKRLVHFKTKANFDLATISPDSIVFIQDSLMIWTHGTFYSCPYTKELLDAKFANLEQVDTEFLNELQLIPEEAPLDGELYVRCNANWVKYTTASVTPDPVEPDPVEPDPPVDPDPPVVDTSIDLSMVDIHGNALPNRTTANCYVVSTTGTYKFPLVYGNGIKNGQVNSAAYTNNGKTNQADFVNYKNVAISSPYIEEDLGETIDGCELSVCDNNATDFADISIYQGDSCKYIKFTVNNLHSYGVNGIISAKVGDKIVWSWHIWIWKHDLTPITITNSAGTTYDILPENLASVTRNNSGEDRGYYQWGRHVPLLRGYTNTGVQTVTNATTAANVGEVLLHPATFYLGDSNNRWVSLSRFYNFWDATTSTTGASDKIIVKTVYDPCPPGYCVPNAKTFSYFSTDSTYSSSGRFFKANSSDTTGIYFGECGRINADGSISSSEGHYWTSEIYDSTKAYRLYFTSSSVNTTSSTLIARGLVIRPVKEK